MAYDYLPNKWVELLRHININTREVYNEECKYIGEYLDDNSIRTILHILQLEGVLKINVKRCHQCEKHFYIIRKGPAKYCSEICKKIVARRRMKSWKNKNINKYREYQRILMQKRRINLKEIE